MSRAAPGSASSATAPAGSLETVARVDLQRYLGRWYEVSRLPNRFQQPASSDVTAEYSPRADGRIDVVNRCLLAGGESRVSRGVAKIVDATTCARLKVRFAPAWLSWLPVVWGDYWVIDLAPDYSHAVVGEPARRFLWVLARQPSLDETTYRGILERISALGYDPAKLVPTPQQRR